MKTKSLLSFACLAAFAVTSTHAAIVAFEAEDAATLGSNFTAESTIAGSSGSYLSSADFVATDNPGSADAVASYDLTLAAGTYDLYARFYVGSGGVSDDSFYVGVGFGTKTLTAGDWYTLNQIAGSKNTFTDPDGVEITDENWVWLNLTDTTTQDENVGSYTTTGGSEVFQYGHREDGFLIDAFAFATDTDTPSVAQLDSALVPEPSSFALLGTLGLLALLRRRR